LKKVNCEKYQNSSLARLVSVGSYMELWIPGSQSILGCFGGSNLIDGKYNTVKNYKKIV